MSDFQADDYILQKVKDVPPSGIRKFFDIVANSKDIISLGVGEPDFVSPWAVREACVYSLGKGYTMYTSNYGMPELRYEISKYLYQRFGLQYDESTDIVVTIGASEAIDIALRVLVGEGDEVLIPEPCYVSYRACVSFAGGTPVSIPLKIENDFKLTPEELESNITPQTKVLLLSFPNNPTGAIMDKVNLEALAKVIIQHDLIVISDEIYSELTYVGPHVSLAEIPGMKDRTVLINGMSKAFAMTGWRIGYVAADKNFIREMVKIHQYVALCAPIMGQMAAIEAFRMGFDEVDRMRDEYNYRRRFIVERIGEIGLEMANPGGAFYAFPSVKSTGISGEEFANRVIQEEKVAVVPGDAFGACGRDFIRCSYATSFKQIVEAFRRIERFVNRL